MRDDLRRLSTGQSLTREGLLDVLATAREGHHLLARITGKLPAPVSSGDPDFVSELLNLAGQFGAVNCGREGLRTIDFDRVEATPLAIRAAGHIRYHYVGVKVRVGTIAVLNSAGGTGCYVIEAGRDDIAGHDPFAPASAARECVLFQFHERPINCLPVRVDEALVVSSQSLDAHRLGCVECRVPTGAAVVVAVRLANENLGRCGPESAQHGAEVLGRDLAGQAKFLRTAAEPLSDDPLLFAVIVVVGVLLLVVSLGLGGGQRAFGHYQH